MAGIPEPDTPQPDLCSWHPLEQAIRCLQFVFVHFVLARFNVNNDELPFVAGFNERTDFALVQSISPPGKLFHAVTRG
jgi:hypothetical protein